MQNFRVWGQSRAPVPPAAGGFAPKPPAPIGLRRLRPQTLQTAPPLRISGYAPVPVA